MGEVVSSSFNPDIDTIDIYHIPAYSMQISELLGSFEIIIDRNNHSNRSKKPIEGVMEKLIKLAIMADKMVAGDKTPTSMNSTGNSHKQDSLLLSL